MSKATLTLTLIIAALVAIIILQRSCNQPPKPVVVTKVDTVWIRYQDTIVDYHPVPVEVIKNGKPVQVTKHDTTFYVTKEAVDTATILSDYFAQRIYSDTAVGDHGKIYIKDTVTQNKIVGRSIRADLLFPSTNTIKPAPLKAKVFAGLGLGNNTQNIGFGPRLFLLTKRDALYGAGADVIPGQPLYYHIDLGWKIHF
jgi:hypothetical protein